MLNAFKNCARSSAAMGLPARCLAIALVTPLGALATDALSCIATASTLVYDATGG
jgi:hypothetical protein